MKTIVKDAMTLTCITLVAGLLLGLVYEITKQPIADAQAAAQQAAYEAVFETADSFEEMADFNTEDAAKVLEENGGNYDAELSVGSQNTIDAVLEAKDSSGEVLGYVINVTDSAGYGGNVSYSIGIANDGTLMGIAFTTLNETAGLGMKAKDEAFSSQFKDVVVESLSVEKGSKSSDSAIQAISGATITSRAVTSGANAALCYFYNALGGGL